MRIPENFAKKASIALVSMGLLGSGMLGYSYLVKNTEKTSLSIKTEEIENNQQKTEKGGTSSIEWSEGEEELDILGEIITSKGKNIKPDTNNTKNSSTDLLNDTVLNIINTLPSIPTESPNIPIVTLPTEPSIEIPVNPPVDLPVEIPIAPPIEIPEEVPINPPVDLLPEQPIEPSEPVLPEPPTVINSKPIIYGQDEIVILKGTTFHPLVYVIAKDREDGDITKQIRVVTSNVNTEAPGVYFVEYQVEDSKGMTDAKRVQVIVNAQPTIHAQNVIIVEGEEFDPLANVKATDEEDGDITSSIQVVSNNVDVSMPGKYRVVYEVADSNEAKVTKQIVVRVKENYVPIILAEDIKIIQGESFDPLTTVTAMDREDGDITSSVQIIFNTVDVSKPGEYEVVYEVTDRHGAITTKRIVVMVEEVKENSVPVIYAEDITILQGEVFAPLANITATDEEDGDITSNILVTSNNVDVNTPGEYEVVYEVTDHHGATTTKYIVVTVIEDNEPIISDEDLTNNEENLMSKVKIIKLQKSH